MAIPNTREMTRRPTHPGEMLREDFLPDYGLSVAGLAEAAGVSRQSVEADGRSVGARYARISFGSPAV